MKGDLKICGCYGFCCATMGSLMGSFDEKNYDNYFKFFLILNIIYFICEVYKFKDCDINL